MKWKNTLGYQAIKGKLSIFIKKMKKTKKVLEYLSQALHDINTYKFWRKLL